MPKNYRKVVDDRTQLQYEHEDGTFIVANKQPNGDWKIIASGTGRRVIGTKSTKKQSKQRMLTWMDNHPKGMVSGMGGVGMGGSAQTDLDVTQDFTEGF